MKNRLDQSHEEDLVGKTIEGATWDSHALGLRFTDGTFLFVKGGLAWDQEYLDAYAFLDGDVEVELGLKTAEAWVAEQEAAAQKRAARMLEDERSLFERLRKKFDRVG